MGRFDDIINREYVKSTTRKHMTMVERAAQFGAFRAVVGHEDALHETARRTEEKIILDEYAKVILDEKLRFIGDNPEENVCITYFLPDDKKTGGAYVSKTGNVVKIRDFERELVMDDGAVIPIDEIVEIKCYALYNAEHTKY